MIRVRPRLSKRRSSAFSLVELLVSMLVFSIIMGLVAQLVGNARDTWSKAASRVSQFRDARLSFELVTRNLSQATLNTYFDYYLDTTGTPRSYERTSELHYISGPADTLIPGGANPTHCAFFQAYLGHTLDPQYNNLGNLLNGRGYYIQFTDGTELAPNFITSPTPRWRFRLWEWMPPSEQSASDAGNEIYLNQTNERAWFSDLGWTGGNYTGRSRLVAENIIALIVSPRTSLPDPDNSSSYTTATNIAPQYLYDSRANPRVGSTPPGERHDLLPPLVQVTIVAMDEPSAIRLENGSTPPAVLPAGLFQTASNYVDDLEALETHLSGQGINFRVFSTTVAMRGAKWDSNAF